jgi:predicted transposase/invertase (TIGR01784 family)
MKRRWLNPLADPVFKRIFGEEKEILIELINAFIQLDEPVVDIEYLPQELLPESADGKISIVDVRCIDSRKRNFILEIQIIRQLSFQERVLYYASKTYGRQLLKNRKYEELQPVYLLSILDHVFDKSSQDWLHRYSLINENDINKKMTGIHLIFLELGKCRKFGNFIIDKLQDRWITFLTEPEKIIAMSKHEMHVYPNLVKAIELLDESNYTPGQLIAYDKYMDSIISWNSTMIESYDNGFDEGLEKGRMEATKNLESALSDLKKGLSIEEVAAKYNFEKGYIEFLYREFIS